MQAHLKAHGIETLIHYPVPIPRQPALAAEAARPTARSPTAICAEVLSLPLHPALPDAAIGRSPTRSPAGRRRRQPS